MRRYLSQKLRHKARGDRGLPVGIMWGDAEIFVSPTKPCREGNQEPRRKRTGYRSRFAPEPQIRIASPRASPQSSGEYVPYSNQEPRRKRTGYRSRFAPEPQIRIASPRASPQSSGDYVPYSIQSTVLCPND